MEKKLYRSAVATKAKKATKNLRKRKLVALKHMTHCRNPSVGETFASNET